MLVYKAKEETKTYTIWFANECVIYYVSPQKLNYLKIAVPIFVFLNTNQAKDQTGYHGTVSQ